MKLSKGIVLRLKINQKYASLGINLQRTLCYLYIYIQLQDWNDADDRKIASPH